MKIISLLLTVLTFLLTVAVVHAKGRVESRCSVCKEIAKSFMQGLDRTKKSNYGGGNTDWEETRLGQYANSEVRLTEIMEHLCGSSECHLMVEEHEGVIDEFWFKTDVERTEENFYNYFCIENVKVCCPENTYGPNCSTCLGGKDRPCKDNGNCVGGGTRGGNGKCKCNSGYSGKFCDKCTEGYYESERNDTHTHCKVCDISCKTSCEGDGPTKCDDCKGGYTYSAENGCEDINECDSNPCHVNSYCINTKGSYSCMSCNVACDGCSASGPDHCTKCNRGYHLLEGKCVDVDECTAEGYEERCTEVGERCENTVGTFRCVCQAGYAKEGTRCKLTEKAPPAKKEEKEEEEAPRQKRREHPMSLIVCYICFAILFFVLGNLCYALNPFLVSIPVGGFAIITYYAIDEYDQLDLTDYDVKEEEEDEEKQESQRDPRQDQLITLLVAFLCFGIFFFVLGNLLYVIHPLLASIPVALFAVVFYYGVKDPPDSEGEEDNTSQPDHSPSETEQAEEPKQEL